MTHRYYAPEMVAHCVHPLSPEESSHAASVMRVRVGDVIELFDGRGRVAEAEVETVTKRSVSVRTAAIRIQSRMPTNRVSLSVAMPRGDSAKELVTRLTELGVRELTPVVCKRTQRPPSDGQIAKWHRAVIEACKQCRRNTMMQIHPVCDFDDDIHSIRESTLFHIAHPPEPFALGQTVEPANSSKCDPHDRDAHRHHVWIGPEGGFTDDEVTRARAAGCRLMPMGELIYRIETAAVVAATLLIHASSSESLTTHPQSKP